MGRWLSLGILLLVAGAGAQPASAEPPPDPWANRPLEAWRADLEDSEPGRREAAARALFLHARDTPDLVGALVARLDDGAPTVRLAALQSLLRLPSPPAAALEQAAQDASGEVAALSLRALGERGQGAEAVLRAALEHADRRVRLAAANVLGTRGLAHDACVTTLGALAADARRTRERDAAIQRLERLGEAAAKAATALAPRLDDADPLYVQDLVRVLLALGPGAVPALLVGAPDGRRLRIVEAIQARRDQPLPDVVTRAAGDDATATALDAMLARHRASVAAGVPEALRALDADDPEHREAAWAALSRAGVAAAPAVWTLLRRLVLAPDDASRTADMLTNTPQAARPYLPELRDALLQGRPHDAAARAAMARVVRFAEPDTDLVFWQEVLASGEQAVREEAAWALAPYADDLPDIWVALVRTLTDGTHLLSGAHEALVRTGRPVVPALHAGLQRAHEAAPRFAAALALARVRDGVIELVEPLAENRHEPGGRAAWPRLVLLHLDPSRTHLLRSLGWSLRNSRDPVKRWFLDAHGRIRRPEDPLLGGLEGLIADTASPLSLRTEAVRALAPFAPEHGLATWILLGAVARPEPPIVEAARAVLATLDESAWRALVPAAARAHPPSSAPRRLTREQVETIEPRFVSRESRIRNNSIFEVSRRGELPDELVRAIAYCLDDEELNVRLAAAHALSHRGRVAEDRLLQALSNDSLEIREAAAQGLRLAGGSTAGSLPYLLEAFRDVDATVERAIRDSIAFRDLRFAHLIRHYREQGEDLRYQLLSRLQWHGEDAWPILELVPPSLAVERTRQAAIEVLLGLGNRGRDALARSLAAADPETAEAIARAYHRLDALREGEALWLRDAAIRFDRMDASWACFRAIAKHGAWRKSVVVTLVQKLEREPARVREGVELLAGSGSEDALPFLAALLGDEQHARLALSGLRQLGPLAAPALDALRHGVPLAGRDELHEVLGVLEAMGTAAAPAAEDLLELLGGDERVEPGRVMRCLVAILPANERDLLLTDQLLDRDPIRRIAALLAIRSRPLDAKERLVIGWLTADPDDRVRHHARDILRAAATGASERMPPAR